MSIRWSATSRSCASVAALPLTNARLLPWASTTRRSSRDLRPRSRVVEPARQRRRAVELRGDLAARATLAHDAGIGARPERELQGIDQDRLAAPVSPVSTEKPRRTRVRAHRR
jgi:hypothetical protein